MRDDNSWHGVTPVMHPSEKRISLQVAFWNTTERTVEPGRIVTPLLV